MKDKFNSNLLFMGCPGSALHMKRVVLNKWNQQLKKEPLSRVPWNFRADDFLQTLPAGHKGLITARDCIYIVMGALVNPFAMPTYKRGNNYQEPKPLSTRFLKKVLGSEYKTFVDTLVNNDAIRLVSMQGEGRARRYVLGHRYQNQPLKLRPYKDARIRRRIKLSHQEHLLESKKLYTAYAPLIYYTWSPALSLDEEAAATYYQTFLKQLLTHAKKHF